MPITQERLREIVQAGQTIEAHYVTSIEEIKALSFRARKGEINAHEFFESLDHITLAYKLLYVPQSLLLRIEDQRYRLTHRANESERRRKERHRRNAGSPMVRTMPTHEEQLAEAVARSNEYDTLSPEQLGTTVPPQSTAIGGGPKPEYMPESDPAFIAYQAEQRQRDELERARLRKLSQTRTLEDEGGIFEQTVTDPFLEAMRHRAQAPQAPQADNDSDEL